MTRNYASGVVLAALVAVVCLVHAGPVSALEFNQSGDVVQITTVNDAAAWHYDVYYTDSTDTPVPQDAGKMAGDWDVTAGQVSSSLVLPPAHRRYRFDVNSIHPEVASGCSTVTVVGDSGEADGDRRPYETYEIKRGGTVLWQWVGGQKPALPVVVAGDVVCLRNMGLVIGTFATGGQVTAFNGVPYLVAVHDEELDTTSLSWPGFTVLYGGQTIPAVDDSGSGTFDNPSWVGYETSPTPDPTGTPNPTGTPDPTGTPNATDTVGGGVPSGELRGVLAAMLFMGSAGTVLVVSRR